MTQDFGFAKHQTPAEFEALEAAAFLAGINHWNAGNKTLPKFAEVNGQKIPVVKSLGAPGQAFAKGWKAAKVGNLATIAA
jgi:hypothetical protein